MIASANRAVAVLLLLLLAGCQSRVAGPNQAPVAKAGPDRVIAPDQEVILDGRLSFDPDDDPLDFHWTLVTGPGDPAADLQNQNQSRARFTAHRTGLHAVMLVVDDGEFFSAPDLVFLRVRPACRSDADCDDKNPCTRDSCLDWQCQSGPVADGSDCDDGLYCTENDLCLAGECQGDRLDCASAADECSRGICDEERDRCARELLEDGTACGQPDCDGPDWIRPVCQAGVCNGAELIQACDNGLVCDGSEGCDPADGCRAGSPVPDGTACDEGDGANQDLCDSVCLSGICQPAPPRDCDDGRLCNGAESCDPQSGCQDGEPPPDGTACDDGDACSSQDACQAGACVSGPTDQDADLDGFMDARCPGGDDCDDTDPGIYPGADESGPGSPVCRDGRDNDCDGLTDWDESACAGIYRKPLTVQAGQIGASCQDPLTGFPLLVYRDSDWRMRHASHGGHVESSEGYDITFFDAAETRLDHEIELYQPDSGRLAAWVRMPTLSVSQDTRLYVYYGNPDITAPSERPAATWAGGYRAVYHLHDDLEDSTSCENHCTDAGSDPAEGQIGDGRLLTKSEQDHLDCGADSSLDLDQAVTASVWFIHTPTADDLARGHLVNRGGGWDQSGYSLFWHQRDIRVELQNQQLGEKTILDVLAPPDGEWHHLAASWDSASMVVQVYLDGVLDATTANFTGPLGAPALNLNLGRNQDQPDCCYFDGVIDEVRISAEARSACWIETGYHNQADPAGFIQVGSEEQP